MNRLVVVVKIVEISDQLGIDRDRSSTQLRFWLFDTKLATMWITYLEMSIALPVQVALLYHCFKHEDILYQGK